MMSRLFTYSRSIAVLFLLIVSLYGCASESDGTIDIPIVSACAGQLDSDGDQVCDKVENQLGLNPFSSDTDLDGFPDGGDFNPAGDGSVTGGSQSFGADDSSTSPANALLLTIASTAGVQLVVGAVEGIVGLVGDGVGSIFSSEDDPTATDGSASASSGSNKNAPICTAGLNNNSTPEAIFQCFDQSRVVVQQSSTYLRYKQSGGDSEYLMELYIKAKHDNLEWEVLMVLGIENLTPDAAAQEWTIPEEMGEFKRYHYTEQSHDVAHKGLSANQAAAILDKAGGNSVSASDKGIFVRFGTQPAQHVDDEVFGFKKVGQTTAGLPKHVSGSGTNPANPGASALFFPLSTSNPGELNPNTLVQFNHPTKIKWTSTVATESSAPYIGSKPWLGTWKLAP